MAYSVEEFEMLYKENYDTWLNRSGHLWRKAMGETFVAMELKLSKAIVHFKAALPSAEAAKDSETSRVIELQKELSRTWVYKSFMCM